MTAALTGAVGFELGGPGWYVYGAVAYVIIAVGALFSPAAIAAQVIGGQVLVGGVLMGQEGPGFLLLVPAVASVIVTAELLTMVARMDTRVECDPRDDLPRAGIAALIGGGVFGAVLLVSGFPGPTDLVAVILASGACVLLATLLVGNVGRPGHGESGAAQIPPAPEETLRQGTDNQDARSTGIGFLV